MNARYTTSENPAVNLFVGEQLELVTREVAALLGDNLHAILLTGGFGRGEGSIAISATGAMHVVNDYDIDVVYREIYGPALSKIFAHLRYTRPLTRLAGKLASQLDIKQIDLCLYGESSYSQRNTPTLADYDLKNGNILLYGKDNPVDGMPEYPAAAIPAFEGTWLLRNRGIGLLLAGFYINNGVVADDKREYFEIEINKAILAMGDALFISEQRYHHSYAERGRKIATVLPADTPDRDVLIALYGAAIRQKLNPAQSAHPGTDPVSLFNQVNELYCRFFLYFESRRLQKGFSDIVDYANCMIPQPASLTAKQWLKLGFEYLRGTMEPDARPLARLKPDRIRSIVLTLCLLLARNASGYSPETTSRAYRIAGIREPDASSAENWKSLTRAFLLLVHPKGELGRALRNR